MKRIVTASAVLLLLAACLSVAFAAEERQTLEITQWLRLGPVPAPLPAFGDEKGRTFSVDELLAAATLDPAAMRPRAGADVILPVAGARAWMTASAAEGSVTMPVPAGDTPAEAWLAVYLAADRWQKAELSLRGEHPVMALLDGKKLDLADAEDGDGRKAELELTVGKHLLLVRAVYDPAREADWTVGAGLLKDPAAGLAAVTDPSGPVDIRDILDAPKVSRAVISPDGRLIACEIGGYRPDGERESWVEVRDARDGSLRRSWRGGRKARASR